MVYSQTGNAYAQLGRQPGKDLWTASTFALDENTGQLRWYWQADCPGLARQNPKAR